MALRAASLCLAMLAALPAAAQEGLPAEQPAV